MLKALMRSWIITMMTMGLVGNVFAQNLAAMDPRYQAQGDSILDKQTGLIWARCSLGQHWEDGAGCKGRVKQFTYGEAQSQVGGGWRMPTKNELVTLIAKDRSNPAIDQVAFPNMDVNNMGYWTDTPDDLTYGWRVFFINGSVESVNRFSPLAVRLVRGGK